MVQLMMEIHRPICIAQIDILVLSRLKLGRVVLNLFIYQARESSLVPAGFLTAQFLQKT